jgi:hypothetical protein
VPSTRLQSVGASSASSDSSRSAFQHGWVADAPNESRREPERLRKGGGSCSGGMHRRSGLSSTRSDRQQLGYEERNQPHCCHITGVGSEEPGEKGRSDHKARCARPPERHSRRDNEDDPAEVTQVTHEREVVSARELAVLKEKINRADHSLPLLPREAVRVTREHTDCDSGDRVERAEEHHPNNKRYAGDRCGDRVNPVQQHPHTDGDEGCENELAEVNEDPLVRVVGDPLIGRWLVAHAPRVEESEHNPKQGCGERDELERS